MISLGSMTTLHCTNRNHLPCMPTLSTKIESSVQRSSCVSRLHEAVVETANDINSARNNHSEVLQLPERLRPELMPNHVAIIMDGNRRWARQRNLPVFDGHTAGKETLKELTRLCSKWGIKVLSVFAFSTENWSRPKEEVSFLLRLIEEVLKSDLEEFMRSGNRISVMGNRKMLSRSLQESITRAEETTKANTGTLLNLAINYGGRYDIVQACKSICKKAMTGHLQVDDIDETVFERELETNDLHNPELLIRTSGELRISNFFLWQLAYCELYFADKMFPDFGEEDFVEALSSFQKRQRRFGGDYYPKA
ncbi:hypothetical protein DCAR_0521679 [Daucus carota subsp. sativus]|uniref:Alkyl transferase n=3 Tax=Daucus carota subsp. sativus TaxID=79200 RepID=A0AAF0X6W9_DAUCS|nr:hypothetical protein DCAR_0521679 [Daucus carota subsp. sativus]